MIPTLEGMYLGSITEPFVNLAFELARSYPVNDRKAAEVMYPSEVKVFFERFQLQRDDLCIGQTAIVVAKLLDVEVHHMQGGFHSIACFFCLVEHTLRF
jgi:hypothetical protein